TGFDESKLSEYYLEVDDANEKYLVMYALLKLGIIKGKSIVFLHTVDLCYRLKLFLERFLVPTAVLNPNLPYNSRQSVLDKFNRGLFSFDLFYYYYYYYLLSGKYLLTTDAIDEHDDIPPTQEEEKDEENVGDEYDMDEADDTLLKEIEKETKALADMHLTVKTNVDVNNPSTKRRTAHDHTINMASNNEVMPHRGIDFREVAAVINFSCPLTLKKYIHRIGRTARAGHYGIAITLISPHEMQKFRPILLCRVRGSNVSSFSANSNSSTLGAVQIIQKLPLSASDLLPFRYRCESIRCSITQNLIKQARLNELKMEILNSRRLQSHFKERQREYELLRHDK
ncbi:ATP-dependent nucleolar RNA helicase, partial [Reticulomyxa filosa]